MVYKKENSDMKKDVWILSLGVLKIVGNLLLLLASFFVVAYALNPFAQWYLGKIPALGVDLYNSVTYAAYQLDQFSLPFNSFKDFWFGGYPLFRDYPQLYYYLMVPFVKTYGKVQGVQMYGLFSLFLLGASSLILFYRLSRNIILALVLVLLVLYSVNTYGALIWGGSIPYFATQFVFPLTLFLVYQYVQTKNRKWLFGSILLIGLASLGHAQSVIAFALPSAALIIFFGGSEWFFKNIKSKIKDIVLLGVGSTLVALPFYFQSIYHLFITFIQGNFFSIVGFLFPTKTSIDVNGAANGTLSQTSIDIANYYKSLPKLLVSDTNSWLFIFCVIGIICFVVALVIQRKIKIVMHVLPFILIASYTALHPFMNAYGYSFLPQGWYRAFWQFPIALGALAAVLWGELFAILSQTVNHSKIPFKIVSLAIILIASAVLAIVGLKIYLKESQALIAKIETGLKYESSSAFPEALGIKIKERELKETTKQLIPSFLNPNDKNRRLYTADASFNIWWNAFFDMPLVRGYVDPPIGTGDRGGLFWLDIAIANDSLVREFGIKEDVAYNNALFLIDWYGVHFFEGGTLNSKGFGPPPSKYLLDRDVFEKEEETKTYGAILKYQTKSGKPELHMELPQSLKFYKIRENHTSPILYPSNAPAIMVFSTRPGYEDIMRLLGSANINSRKLIPVYGGQYIDSVSLSDLESFDAVILSEYSYKNRKKGFDLLEKYVRQGGNLYVDSGAEVKNSENSNLPEPFPITSSIRRGYGRNWDLKTEQSVLLEDVDTLNFGKLVFNEDEWKIAVPQNAEHVREGSKVILKHKGKPVLIERKLGEGKIVWSGFNLPYHYNQYKSDDEAKLFINILSYFTKIEDKPPLSAEAQWLKQEKVEISTSQKPRGILFKEQGYEGWSVKLASEGNRKLPYYLVGPTYPGFMYVPLRNYENSPVRLQFSYTGEKVAYISYIISAILTIFLLEKIVLSGKLFGERLDTHSKKFTGRIYRKVASWWEREEEE